MGNLNSQFRCLGLHLAIMADGASRGVPFSEKDRQTLTVRSRSEGSSFLYVAIPKLGRAVDQGLVSGTFKCPAGFSLKSKTRLPNFLSACFSQVFGVDGSLLEEPNVVTIFFLRQLLLVNSKLRNEFTVEQQDACVEEFASRQERLKRLRLPRDHFVLLSARNALKKALRHLDLLDIKPGHGPGVVHEKKPRDARWEFTYWSARANRTYPFSEYGAQGLEHLRRVSDSVVYLDEMTTRICLVPKDFRGPRLISVEMSGNQYLQQGQMRSMMAYFERNRLLSRSIRLSDQAYSQDRARTAYQDGAATLDLSNASDTVSSALVWYLLSEMPRLRRQLFSTRSDFATWKDRKIRLAAFAPMGSATCFPVETLVFWSLAIGSMALVRYGRRAVKLSYQDLLSLGRELVVFGDDIIVPEDSLSTLIATLQVVGCEPNMSKTCWLTPFRESCGSEWFNGTDVTIIRNKEYAYDTNDHKSDHFPDLQSLQRRFFVMGLRESARLVLAWANSIAPCVLSKIPDGWMHRSVSTGRRNSLHPDPLGEEAQLDPLSPYSGCRGPREFLRLLGRYDAVCLWDDDLIDRRSVLRWHSDLQRIEFRTPVLFQRHRGWGLADVQAGRTGRETGYSRLLARLLDDSSDRIPIPGISTKIGWRQMPSGAYRVVSSIDDVVI